MNTPCREYQGALAQGYGVRWDKEKGANDYLHRWVVAQVDGWEAIDGKVVLHDCDNPPCFRYDHLKIGTTADNNADRDAKGRQNGPRGESHHWAKLSLNDVRAIRLRHSQGETQASLASEYGVHPSTLSYAIRRSSWR